MRRKDREYKVETNGVPDLTQAPKDLLELFCTAVLESILSETGKDDLSDEGDSRLNDGDGRSSPVIE